MIAVPTKPKNILVAPLDWGLGHATRCIPIINILLAKGCMVSIASSGSALSLLKREYPTLNYLELPSYRASYSNRLPLMLKVFLQIPKFVWTIKKEKMVIAKYMRSNKIDAIISDNRYGCYSEKTLSIFVGHQLHIIMPVGLKWLTSLVNYFNHKWILKFNESWVPDDQVNELTGKLSKPLLPNSKRIGILSRLQKKEVLSKVFDLAVVLSGPEPQRSIFEKMVFAQFSNLKLKAIVVRGVIDEIEIPAIGSEIKIMNYLSSLEMQEVLSQSKVVLCRSGYSSVMDLAMLEMKAILVPTPGQTEQEYLAAELMRKKITYSQSQDEFDLQVALKKIKDYSGFVGWKGQPNLLERRIDQLLK